MRIIVNLILLALVGCPCIFAQDAVRKHLNRYDYKGAVTAIDSLMACENADSVSLAIEKAKCLRKLYRVEDAVGALSEVLHLDQYNTELMAEMAECHVQMGNSAEAFTWYSMLTRLQPENTYFKLCQARILYREKQYRESIAFCKDIIVTDFIPEVMSMIGDGYKNTGQADSALVYYDKVLTFKPKHAQTISKKADILLSAKQYDPVIEMSESFLKEDPDNMTILPIYGLALFLKDKYPQSIEVFEHQKKLGDESYSVHYYIGLNYYMMNYWKLAEPELEKAYQIDSSDVKLVFQLAHAKGNLVTSPKSGGLDKESERLYEKALGMLEPDPAMLHNIYGSMALARHRIEDYKDAIKYYELSYKYNKKNISAISSIGLCYERMKEYDKALKYYEMYLKLGKPGTAGYAFVEESIAYIKQEKFMEER